MSDKNQTTPNAKLASESYDEKFDRMKERKAKTTKIPREALIEWLIDLGEVTSDERRMIPAIINRLHDDAEYKCVGGHDRCFCNVAMQRMPNMRDAAMTTKTTIFLCALMLLTACDKPLTNEEIVKQTEYCHEHNLKAWGWHNNFWRENDITHVECHTDE